MKYIIYTLGCKVNQYESQAMETLLSMYRPLLMKEAVVNGIFDEDLYQELCIVFLRCVRNFRA